MGDKGKTTKPWQLKEWRDKRQTILGQKCEQCGSETPPFVVQHTWHPPKHKEVFQIVMNEYFNELFRKKEEKYFEEIIEPQKDQFLAECCPKCELLSFYERKTITPKWRCSHCGYEFDEPSKKFWESHPGVKKKRSEYFKQLYQKYKVEIKKRADEINKKNHERYMSMKDTKTFCKKCAYKEDIEHKKLCSICKEKYHYKGYPVCKECLLKEFKKAEVKMKIGQKDEKCENCFWLYANHETWTDFNGTLQKMLDVKARKCNECISGNSNYSEIWKCKKCETPIDGHNNFLHGGMCDSCWSSATQEDFYDDEDYDEEDIEK
ncbi:hypothetical protein JXB41_07145 [Candidatus Woesearchaeota archaeon]|nr:hypothetical protein [Candidatus Woesearchaeota archaeon]